jgi:two-component system phosphate regulon sensor histidine kinase PhoR
MTTLSPASTAPALWQALLVDLAGFFDAHAVCAAVAARIAATAGTRALVALSDSEGQHFDVWLAEEAGDPAAPRAPAQLRWSREKAGFSDLLARERPAYYDKFSRPASELINSELWLLPHKDILVAPLPYPAPLETAAGADGRTQPGLIVVIDPVHGGPLTESALGDAARLATVFLDRAALRLKADRQDVEFGVISDISRSLSATLDRREIFSLLTGPIRRTLNVETLSVGLVEPATGDIIFVDQLLGAILSEVKGIRLQRGQGIAGWVAERGEPVVINDAYSDRRFFSGVDSKSGFRTRSMICIPLQVEERTIGVVQAINRVTGKFTDRDLALLQAIGGPLAAAIENANLHGDVVAEKNRVETIFGSMAEGLITINREGIITRANDAFLSLLVGEPSVTGRPAAEVIRLRSGDLSSFLEALWAAPDTYPQLASEMLQSSGRPVPVLISGAAVGSPVSSPDDMPTEAILVFSDLTMVREVERMREDLFQGIIHELRTPLATILMYARLLREGKVRQPDKAERFLGVIERESDRLQKMVRQMLELAKMDATELRRSAEPVRINPILDDVLPPLAEQAVQKGLLFRQRIEPELPPVMGNADTYQMVIRNLVENAVKFTPSGSIQIAARRENGSVVLEVSDDGIGIPAEALPHVFKRFYRTQTAVERGVAGTGLGLYMVKESLGHYNGRIGVRSEDGKGTTFTVTLPIAQE